MASKILDRRTVVKSLGVGIVGGAAIPGFASASGDGHAEGAYGDGHGLGAFLNEEAVIKDGPIWNGDIVDARGRSVVDVAVGAMTSIDAPGAPPALPVAFDPLVVKVSPGATVRWTWVSNPLGIPIPHDVTSLVDEDGEVVLEPSAGQRYHFDTAYTPTPPEEEDITPTFEFTFDERGNHLYYCTPHGAPFPLDLDGFGEVTNLMGMRGAVKVAGKAL